MCVLQCLYSLHPQPNWERLHCPYTQYGWSNAHINYCGRFLYKRMQAKSSRWWYEENIYTYGVLERTAGWHTHVKWHPAKHILTYWTSITANISLSCLTDARELMVYIVYSRVSFFLASQWTENQRNKCVKITRIISGRRTMRMRAYNKYYYNNATSHFARHTLTQHICEVVQT